MVEAEKKLSVDTEASAAEAVLDDHDDAPVTPGRSFRRVSVAKQGSARKDHLEQLVNARRASVKYMGNVIEHSAFLLQKNALSTKMSVQLTSEQKEEIVQESNFIKEVSAVAKKFKQHFPSTFSSVEVKVQDFSYKVQVEEADSKIHTVYNQSAIYNVWSWMKRVYHRQKKAEMQDIVLLDSINLVFKPGRMYLILGDPETGGKEVLLKAIAGRLHLSSKSSVEGSILYNGTSLAEKDGFFIENNISYIDKIDFHAPRMTVEETFTFAFNCKNGGTHMPPGLEVTEEAKAMIDKLDKEEARVHITLNALGLAHVGETFVGNAGVRGVSGGQRRRVSLGEMVQNLTPVMCGDEISTGLDAAATYDICRTLMFFGQLQKMVRVLSLLQPSPETVALFDEVILLAEGKVLYAGPIGEVEEYFSTIGYHPPDQMDVADFLQVISTDGAHLYKDAFDMYGNGHPYTMSELADKFKLSSYCTRIEDAQSEPWEVSWADKKDKPLTGRVVRKYQNSFPRAAWLNLSRTLLIWTRDRRFLFASVVKNVIMGVSVGGVFYQTDSYVSIFGVCFQINLFIMLGAMVSAPSQIDDRVIFYKHHDANFYGAFPYVLGKAIGLMPQALIDVLIFGTIIYWMVGLSASAAHFFIYIAVLFVFSCVTNQMLSIFGAITRSKGDVQAASACVLLFLVLFCGFIVNPDVIPNYYIWIYWWNPLAWTYRALLINEFTSSEYDEIVDGNGNTAGELVLLSQGFEEPNGDAMGKIWIAFNFAYQVPFFIVCIIITTVGLMSVHLGKEDFSSLGSKVTQEESEKEEEVERINVPVKPINLTFKGVCYDVHASTGRETIRLLNDVNGVFTSKKMIALMGSSGAGKTTLMDVIAMRKNSGTVIGQILVNGFPQDRKTFRRVTGYVEQFDVQAPELTVRETVLYSARLRLDSRESVVATNQAKDSYVELVLFTLELTSLSDCLVGNDEEGGLSFEQRKRLSIAVELAASPSIIFLDEPTSGLDARAACIVVRSLRRIADTGRTVIATIHQPSLNVFEMFDELLLLKTGGNAVFSGELGEQCANLIDYFESTGADPIEVGENPANWMLKVITDEKSTCDYAEEFLKSINYTDMMSRISATIDESNAEDEIKFDSEFATLWWTRQHLTNKRFQTIYFRSPAYNLSRIVISMVIAFILGSVFLSNRFPSSFTETEISSLFSTIFISFILIGVLAINSVLPVMLKLRDSFYRHRAAGMVDSWSVTLALAHAEKWFILFSSLLFCLIFIGTAGLHFTKFRRLVSFWGFFTFNLALYSYFGQAFMCLVRGMGTAQILASVFIGLNNFFSGLIVRPQYLTGVFQFTYWITPGHYVYEGMIVSLFTDDDRTVFANDNSAFYEHLGCTVDQEKVCEGTVEEFMLSFFGGKFLYSHRNYDLGVLAAYLIVARLTTLLALRYLNFTST